MSSLERATPRLLGHALPLARPDYLPSSDWIGHLPFASWLVEVLRPQVLVELGVHDGASYCGFCEAVSRGELPTICSGIDNWISDAHGGFDGGDELAQLRAYHDPRYGTFSRLIHSSFDEVLEHFADDSVDLLHINGGHGYEAVRHDFESWRPKLSRRAVVLLHDTNVREGSSGVWRFWEEVTRERPHFSFLHGCGLGVLGEGEEHPEAVGRLFAADDVEAAAIRSVFGQLGQGLAGLCDLRRAAGLDSRESELRGRGELDGALPLRMAEMGRLLRRVEAQDAELARLGDQLAEVSDLAEQSRRLLNVVKRSRSWLVTAPLRRIGLFGRREKRIFKRPPGNPDTTPVQTTSDQIRRPVEQRQRPPASYRLSRLQAAGTAATMVAGPRRLVCISHVLPFPPRAGNEYRIHRMLGWLRTAGWAVTLVVAPLPGEEPDDTAVAALASAYPDLVLVRRDGRVSYRLSQGAASLEALDGRRVEDHAQALGEPARADRLLETERVFAHDGLIGVVKALVDGLAPRALLVNYAFMTRMLPLMPAGLLKLVDTHDVFSTRRQKVVRHGIRDDLALTGVEEGRLLARADLVIAIQPDEQRELERIVHGRPVVTAGVDVDIAAAPPRPLGRTILFVASGNAMNVRGLEDFLEFTWPFVLRAVPDAELRIAGPVGEAVDVDDERVLRLGRVNDLAALYAEAKVVINPAIAGTGLKIKTVEALGQLRPVVAWPSGVEGLGSEARALCDVVDSWYTFAEAVVRRLRQDQAEVGEAGRHALLARLFSAESVYAALGEALAARIEDRPAAS